MEPADGVVSDAVIHERHFWRGALMGAASLVGVGLFVLLAPQSAHADDGPGLLGGVVDKAVTTVTTVVDPVVPSVPAVRDVPVVGDVVGSIVDSAPVSGVVTPVADLVDGIAGDTVGSLPIVGEVLGTTPVGSVTEPVTSTVDETLVDVVGTPASTPAPAPGTVDAVGGDATPSAAIGRLVGTFRASDLAVGTVLAHLPRAAAAIVTGAEGLTEGPVSAPGDITPASAVTAGGAPIGAAAAVLGAGLLLLLARGRLRPGTFRAPPAPVYATDTSPD